MKRFRKTCSSLIFFLIIFGCDSSKKENITSIQPDSVHKALDQIALFYSENTPYFIETINLIDSLALSKSKSVIDRKNILRENPISYFIDSTTPPRNLRFYFTPSQDVFYGDMNSIVQEMKNIVGRDDYPELDLNKRSIEEIRRSYNYHKTNCFPIYICIIETRKLERPNTSMINFIPGKFEGTFKLYYRPTKELIMYKSFSATNSDSVKYSVSYSTKYGLRETSDYRVLEDLENNIYTTCIKYILENQK
jgi:hypothetical protein